MLHQTTRFLFLFGVLFGALAASGCTIVSAECREVCEHYSDCVDGQFDSDECVHQCEANADLDDSFEERVLTCSTCFEDFECQGACNTSCVDVVPPL